MNCEYKLIVEEGFITHEGALLPLVTDAEPKVVIPYAEYKKLGGLVEVGTLVTGVKASELFVTQNWASAEKSFSAEKRLREEPERARRIPVYLGVFKGRKVLGAGDGTHRIVTAKLNGDRIDAFIVGELPSNLKLIPVNQYIQANSDFFQTSLQSK